MVSPPIVVSVNAAWNLVNFRRSLLCALVAAGYRVVAIAPPDGREAELEDIGVEFRPIPMRARGMSPLSDLRLFWAYIRILRLLRPCAFLGFTVKPNVYGGIACRMLGIAHIANIAGLGTAFLRRDALNMLVRNLYVLGLRRAATVFFQNSQDRDRFLNDNMADPARARLLPGSGVNLKQFMPIVRQEDGKTVFVLVARLLHAKGVGEYVEAASRIRARRGKNVIFRILGIRDSSPAGIDVTTLQQWQAQGDIELLEAVSDVRPVLEQADCVVLPSYYPEGTPRSLLEAAATGKPIITTNMPGCRDVVDDGLNGFLCAPRDIDALVLALERFLELDNTARSDMGRRSREKAERQFDERFVIDAYLKAIGQAVRAPSSGG